MLRLIRLATVGAAVLFGTGTAAAQISKIPIPGITAGTSGEDWATCGAVLPACSETRTDCCYRTFDPGSVIIPMDRCHQAFDVNKLGPVSNAASPVWCADPNSTMDGRSKDMGLLQAYGLMYRLMQAGIPVYWMVNPTKEPPKAKKGDEDAYTAKDIDFWVLSPGTTTPPTSGTLASCGAGCTDPVKLLHKTTLAPLADTYNRTAFPLRGAFVVAAQDRSRFDNFWKKQGEFASFATNTNYDFSAIDVYEIQASGSTPARLVYQDYRQANPVIAANGASAPVGQKVDYRAPRLARIGPANVSTHWLIEAKLDVEAAYPQCLDPANTWAASAVYCTLTEADIKAGKLTSGKFDWAWIDQGNSYDAAFAAAITTFLTATTARPGGSVLFEGDAADSYDTFIAANGTDNQGTALGEDMIIRYPHNLISQMGDFWPEFASGGSIGYWKYFGGSATGYRSTAAGTATPAVAGTMKRLFTSDATASASNPKCTAHKSTATCDVFANHASADLGDTAVYWRYNDVADNGILFYVGGRNPQSSAGHLRVLLNALIAIPSGTTLQTLTVGKQIARSSPVIASVGTAGPTTYQGSMSVQIPVPSPTTYAGSANNATFRFPHIVGHIHALPVGSLSLTTVTQFSDANAIESFPAVSTSGCGGQAFSGTCRTVFTNTATGLAPAIVQFGTSNRSTLKPLIGATLSDTDADVLISRVLAGIPNATSYVPKLGGVDRSTVAIIEPSPNAGPTRPTMIYAGALDGMLHAFCAEAKSGTACTTAGRELWAYIPRTQLGRLRQNSARIDGSPKVTDVQINGVWRTVLVFQTGSGDPAVASDAPAVIALDVTNPAAPSILWERTTPATRGSIEQGVGLGIALGPIAGGPHAFIQTANGGTGAAGFVVDAIDLATGNTTTGAVGAPRCRFSSLYPAPRTGSNPPVPSTGIPPGVTLADTTRGGQISRVLVPTLYGQVFALDAATGANSFGSSALFNFTTDFHPVGAPVSLYRTQTDGSVYALIVSGGYADPVSTTWSPATTHQYAVAITIEPPSGTNLPMTNAGTLSLALRPFVYDLGVVQRAFGQAVIAGGEVFIATDSADENATDYGFATTSTGKLHRLSLSGNSISTVDLGGGASGVDVGTDGRVVVGAGAGSRRVDSAGFSSNGVAMELLAPVALRRRFWLAD